MIPTLQMTEAGQLKHFLSIEKLPQELLLRILDQAESFVGIDQKSIKSVPLLRGKTIVTLFFEPSTRTHTTFDLAAKRLSATVLNLNIDHSATKKGESLMDMLRNLEAMAVDMLIVRHPQSGAPHFLAQHVAPGVSVVNAGDGRHAHPTQAMLDMYTIRAEKGGFEGLRVAIVGDILHSRVARSQIEALHILGTRDIRIVGPKTLIPNDVSLMPVSVHHDLRSGLEDVDVVILLRLQKERMQTALLPSSHEFYQRFGLTPETLKYADPRAIVMHPGPINRGVEIASEVADGPQSVILKQVRYGLAVRMAVLALTLSGQQVANTMGSGTE